MQFFCSALQLLAFVTVILNAQIGRAEVDPDHQVTNIALKRAAKAITSSTHSVSSSTYSTSIISKTLSHGTSSITTKVTNSTSRSVIGSASKSSTSPVTYSGRPISGTSQLPPSLSSVVFPSNLLTAPFPGSSGNALGKGSLSQNKTNGRSWFGTFDAPKLPQWVGGPAGGPANLNANLSAPWGNRTARGTNQYTSGPNTGAVRSYVFVLGRGTLAPDGYEREMLLINGQFPGPLIEANWGDTIQVTVTNNISGPVEGTSLHWHGLLQQNTGYEDGVPGITQCPIAPGQSFTYSFKADLYGTSWYHSHYSAQYAGGAFGPMIIHGPPNAIYNSDLGPIMLTDYYHDDYNAIVADVMGTDLTKIAPASLNNLINGKGDFDCSLATDNVTCTSNAGLSKFQFTSGKSYRLRLINAGAEGIQRFSIDGHVLSVIAYDFVPIVPYNTTSVTLGVGQRADVVVVANGSSDSAYWMRSTISSTCSLSSQPKGLAIIYYEHANTTAQPSSSEWTVNDSECQNDALATTRPFYSLSPETATTTIDIALSFEINSTGHFLWTMDGSSFRTDYNDPILPLAIAGNDSYPYSPDWNVYNMGSNKSFVIVINNANPIAHPMHIHGHNMFILSTGTGTWDGTVVNSTNPMRRDVQLLPPSGYIAIQVTADNPGVWPFHCHIAWHVSGGLYVNILERPSDIPNTLEMPSSFTNLCTQWNAWTKEDVPDQIDSGLRRRSIESEAENLHQQDIVRKHMSLHKMKAAGAGHRRHLR